MAIMSSYNKNPIILLLSWLLFSSNSLHASEDPQRKPTIVVIGGGGDCNYGNNLKDIPNYAELKHDSKASLPSSFTICVSVLAAMQNQCRTNAVLFTLLRNNGSQWFSAQIRRAADFVGKQFYYPEPNHFTNIDTVPVFPNEWVRSCLALNTFSGLVQWVARGEIVDNSTLAGIAESKDIPRDLTGKLILGVSYWAWNQKWEQKGHKVTDMQIFSSALPEKNAGIHKGRKWVC